MNNLQQDNRILLAIATVIGSGFLLGIVLLFVVIIFSVKR
jgi:hypothetical protein